MPEFYFSPKAYLLKNLGATRRGNSDDLTVEILHGGDIRTRQNNMRKARHIATNHLDVSTVCAGEDSGTGTSLNAVDLAGQQRLNGSCAIF